METTLSFFTSLIYTIYGYCVGIFIFNNNKRTTNNVVLTFLVYWLLYYFIIFIMDSTYSLFFSCVMFIPLLKSLFHEKILKTVAVASIAYSFILIFEVVITKIVSSNMLDSLCNFNNYNNLKFYIAIVSVIIAFIYTYIFKNRIKLLIRFISRIKYYWILLIVLFGINVLLSINIRYSELVLNRSTILDCLFIITLVTIFIYTVDKNNKYDSLDKHYNDLYEYSKLSEDCNYDYRIKLHENKNQLLLIDSMIDDKKKLKEYINYLLEQHNIVVNNYYLSCLTSIPIPGMKSFINYKLVELKSIGATIELFVSEEIKDIDINLNERDYNDISVAIGVILDNIIDAVRLQKEKLVSLNIYLEDEKLHFQCANSYDGEIDVDKIFRMGYSTKGANRGVGLSLVKDIIENNDIIDCKPLVIDNFFMQDIIIKVPKIIK